MGDELSIATYIDRLFVCSARYTPIITLIRKGTTIFGAHNKFINSVNI